LKNKIKTSQSKGQIFIQKIKIKCHERRDIHSKDKKSFEEILLSKIDHQNLKLLIDPNSFQRHIDLKK
jgi:hypothetical protein